MVLELLAEIAQRQNRFDDAVELLDELQQRHGPFPRITALIGDMLATHQPDKARDDWLKAAQLQAGVDLKAVHHKLADSFTTAGNEHAAQTHRALGHYFVGRELLHFGYADKSINYFAGSTELDPSLEQAWFYLGESRRLSGQSDSAREAYQKCLERNPHHGRALAILASMASR
jgi:tetratricopeptide (TPR) repeat protein